MEYAAYLSLMHLISSHYLKAKWTLGLHRPAQRKNEIHLRVRLAKLIPTITAACSLCDKGIRYSIPTKIKIAKDLIDKILIRNDFQTQD